MDINLLKTFLVVAKYGNITMASEEIHLTQPAVTKQIQLLEDKYQTRLFERGKTLRLTEQGSILFAHAMKIIEAFENSIEAVQMSSYRVHGTIRFGANMTIGSYVMPPIISAFSSLYPDVSFDLAIHNTETILRLLKQKMCNIVFGTGDMVGASMTRHFFFTDQLVIVSGKAFCDTEGEKMSWKQLQVIPFIAREKGSDIRMALDRWLKQRNIKLSTRIELTNIEATKQYVANGLGFSVLPRFTVIKEVQQGTLFIISSPPFNLSQNSYIYQSEDARLTNLEKLFLRFLFKSIEAGHVRSLLLNRKFQPPLLSQ